MATYPMSSSVPYGNPIVEDLRFKTLRSSFDEQGAETRKRKWLWPKRDFTLRYNALTYAEAQTLWQFYTARHGGYEEFSFFYSTTPGPVSYTSEYVGKGDGATVVFNLPAKNSSSVHTVKVGGVTSTAYTFSAGGGPDGGDRITFSTAAIPTSTQYITYSFTGRLKAKVTFAEDVASFEQFYSMLVNHGVKLHGVLNS